MSAITPAPDRVICILGMHRSGTSCLTGSLQQSGLFLGECHTWNPFNLKGNRENQRFVDFHDDLLTANEGAWDRPPARVRWQEKHFARAHALLAEQAGQPLFGFKDPRTLLVLDGWKAVFPGMEFIGIFRHPNAVARSLANRSGIARDEALSLWYRYNRSLYREFRRRSFPILCFDDAPPVFHQVLRQVIEDLRIPRGSAPLDFFEEQLRTAGNVEGDPLPWKIQRLYNKLGRAAVRRNGG
jgi:hypothetical protein